jgi:hypothetical protein
VRRWLRHAWDTSYTVWFVLLVLLALNFVLSVVHLVVDWGS